MLLGHAVRGRGVFCHSKKKQKHSIDLAVNNFISLHQELSSFTAVLSMIEIIFHQNKINIRGCNHEDKGRTKTSSFAPIKVKEVRIENITDKIQKECK
jgi:hypothetical protein